MNRLSPSYTLNLINKSLVSPINTVIDVGVQTKTSCLMEVFPDAHHFLFEPVKIYHAMLKHNYQVKGIKYSLIEKAVSNKRGVMFQHLLKTDLEHGVTHSQLLDTPNNEIFGQTLHSIIETEVVSLDDWSINQIFGNSYLVKIDVDGIEDKIIEGGNKVLSQADVIMIESSLVNVSARTKKIEELGFKLFDIVGNGYYYNQLQQVDLIFVSINILETNLTFQPWKRSGEIQWDQWEQFE